MQSKGFNDGWVDLFLKMEFIQRWRLIFSMLMNKGAQFVEMKLPWLHKITEEFQPIETRKKGDNTKL